MKNTTIAFLGAGNMARAICGGLLQQSSDLPSLWISNPSAEKLTYFSGQGCHITQNNIKAVQQADIVVLAVKPQHIQTVCEEIKDAVKEKKCLVISVAAGVASSAIEKWLGGSAPVVRAMPNTPAMVSTGATGLYANDWVTAEQRDSAESLFRAVGITLWIKEESLMPAVIAISGSGPAYIFLVIEAIQAAGEKMGLSTQDAQLLTEQTVLGAARMAIETDQSAATLRHAVTSPNGTTEQAINVLEAGKLPQLIADAMAAASQRAKDLTQQLSE